MKVLALAYYYPPNGGSGTHRSLALLNRLAASGDEVTVVTAKEQDFSLGTSVDSELLLEVAPGIRIIRAAVVRPFYALLKLRQLIRGRGTSLSLPPTAAPGTCRRGLFARGFQGFKDAISDALRFPDEHVGWIPDALRQCSRVIRVNSPDCLYSSGGPWSSHVAAALLKRRYGLPLVLDFRDPWTRNPYQVVDRGPVLQALERKLEAFCIKAADHVVVNTEALRLDFIRNYPREPVTKFTTIYNGFDSVLVGPRADPGERFTLLHAGALYPPRNPATFLRALALLIRQGAIQGSELRVRFVGGCSEQTEVLELLQTPELKDIVQVIPRVPHSSALRYQMEADVLLLFQNGFPLQVPRKLFEYMALLKPVLAIAERGSATAAVIQDSGVGLLAQEDVGSISRALLELYAGWKRGARASVDRERLFKFRNDSLAMQLRAVLQGSSKPLPARAVGVTHD